MTGAVSGVPAEAIEPAAEAVYNLTRLAGSYDRWSIANPGVQESYRADAHVALEAALPALREVIAAEVLGPVREYVDTLATDLAKAEPKHFAIGLMRLRVKELGRILSAPVQPTSNGCDVCGAPSTHVTTPGGMRGCDDHFTGGRS